MINIVYFENMVKQHRSVDKNLIYHPAGYLQEPVARSQGCQNTGLTSLYKMLLRTFFTGWNEAHRLYILLILKLCSCSTLVS
jgi:hypothetical protein